MLPQDLLRLLKLSAKKSFDEIRKKGPFFCEIINLELKVTREFFDHISFQKSREIKEIISRLLIIPFIEDIIHKGTLIEKRIQGDYIYFQLALLLKKESINIVIRKKNEKIILLSCFVGPKWNITKK